VQGCPRKPLIASRKMIGTMQSAATGSAHHHPKNAFKPKPANKIIAR
jgi:hypothetical protein